MPKVQINILHIDKGATVWHMERYSAKTEVHNNQRLFHRAKNPKDFLQFDDKINSPNTTYSVKHLRAIDRDSASNPSSDLERRHPIMSAQSLVQGAEKGVGKSRHEIEFVTHIVPTDLVFDKKAFDGYMKDNKIVAVSSSIGFGYAKNNIFYEFQPYTERLNDIAKTHNVAIFSSAGNEGKKSVTTVPAHDNISYVGATGKDYSNRFIGGDNFTHYTNPQVRNSQQEQNKFRGTSFTTPNLAGRLSAMCGIAVEQNKLKTANEFLKGCILESMVDFREKINSSNFYENQQTAVSKHDKLLDNIQQNIYNMTQ